MDKHYECVFCRGKDCFPTETGKRIHETKLWYMHCPDCGAQGPLQQSSKDVVLTWTFAAVSIRKYSEQQTTQAGVNYEANFHHA